MQTSFLLSVVLFLLFNCNQRGEVNTNKGVDVSQYRNDSASKNLIDLKSIAFNEWRQYLKTNLEMDSISNERIYTDTWFDGDKIFFDSTNNVILYVLNDYPILYFKKLNMSNSSANLEQMEKLIFFGYLNAHQSFVMKYNLSSNKFRETPYSIYFDDNKIIENSHSETWTYNEIDSTEAETILEKSKNNRIYMGYQDSFQEPKPLGSYRSKLNQIIKNTIVAKLPKDIDIARISINLKLLIDKQGNVTKILKNEFLFDKEGGLKDSDALLNDPKTRQFSNPELRKIERLYQKECMDLFKSESLFKSATNNNNLPVNSIYGKLISIVFFEKTI